MVIASISITTGGINYIVGDVLTIPKSTIGGSVDGTCTVTSASAIVDSSLIVTKLTGTQLDAFGRPLIASTNPYS